MILLNGIVKQRNTRLRVNAPERNRRKIQDSGLILLNEIVERKKKYEIWVDASERNRKRKMGLWVDVPERNRREGKRNTRLRVDAPERNHRKIRDFGLMLPNGIVEKYKTPG